MAKAWKGEELARNVFYLCIAGVAIEIGVMVLIGF